MKRYRADLPYIRINTIEIEKESGNRIYFRNGKYERHESKYHKYFITWDEAKQHIVEHMLKEISTIYTELSNAKADLLKAENLKRSETETILITKNGNDGKEDY